MRASIFPAPKANVPRSIRAFCRSAQGRVSNSAASQAIFGKHRDHFGHGRQFAPRHLGQGLVQVGFLLLDELDHRLFVAGIAQQHARGSSCIAAGERLHFFNSLIEQFHHAGGMSVRGGFCWDFLTRERPPIGRSTATPTWRLRLAASRQALKTRGLGEVDPESVAPALVAAGHLGGGVAEVLLDVALVDLGRGGEPGAQ